MPITGLDRMPGSGLARGTLFDKELNVATISAPTLTSTETIVLEKSAENKYTITWTQPSGDNRTLSIPALGADDQFTFNAATQTLTNKTISGGSATGLTDLDMTVGNKTILDTIGSNTLTIGAGGTTVVIAGNLTVSGTTTTVNSNVVSIGDALILLNSDESGTPSHDSGYIIERGSSTNVGLIWDESADEWAAINTSSTGTEEGNVTISSYANLQAATVTAANISAFTLDGKLTAGSNEIEGSAFDINGGTVDAITSLTIANNVDVGNYTIRANNFLADSHTATRVFFAGTDGVLTTDSDLTFATDTLTATKIGAFTAAGAIDFDNQNMTNVDIDSGDMTGVTISGALTWSAAQNLNSQALTNVNIDSGAIDAVTIGTNSAATELQVDNININGNTITSTDSNGDITLTPNGTGEVNIAAGDLNYAGTAVLTTGAELNILDGGTSATGTTLVAADRVVVNDNGTMVQVAMSDFETFMESNLDTLDSVTSASSLATVGALNAGSITSGFGAIDNGSSAITTTGTITGGSITADDINLNGKVLIMTGSASDTVTMTAATNGAFSLVTVDDAAAAANIQITADGTVDIDSAGVLTLDSGAAINIEPAAGSAILLDGTISIDAGVVTGVSTLTMSGELDAGSLDISGDADIDGTLEADAITVDGTTLAEYIADTVGAMVTSNTESGITVAYQDADNTLDFTVGTLNQDTTGTAAIATTVTITDNESTNEDNALIFTAGGDVDGGNIGLESDGTLTYNPSTGKVTATGFIGVLTGNVTGDVTGTASLATVTDSTANTDFPVVFNNESNGLLDDTGTFEYNPSTGLITTTGITASGTVTWGSLSDGAITVTAFVDEDNMSSDSATLIPTQQSVKAYVDSQSAGMSNFILEDGDGTEVTVSDGKEVKFVEGGGIDINWTDTDNGTDADPYDLTFTVNAAQTGITSIYATDLILGEDAQTAIDFGTANEIDFKADNAARLTLTSSALYPVTDNEIDLGTASLEFKDAFFDGTVTADAFAGPLTGNVTGTADVATVATTVTITDNESTNEDNALIFTAGGDVDGGNLGLESDGTLTYNPSTGKVTATGFIGALTGDVTGTADVATVATTVTITDNENTNENNALIFTSGGDLDGGNIGLESDGDLYYNPSTSTLTVPNVSVSGTFSTVNSVTMDANNAVIFEGASADAHETTLTSVDATGDRTISLPNVSGTLPVLAAASTTQITSTPEEINLIDGGTARGTDAVASGDGILINDAGTMKMTNVDTVSTYFASHSVGGTNIVTTGALNAGSITSGFGTIDTGSSTITTTGAITGGALTIDDVAIDGKVVTMTGSSSDTAVFTVGTNGTLSIVTTDDAAAAANIQITADGTVDIDSAGVLTLDSGAAINIEPAAGSAILLDGTISIDAGVITGATSITSTAFVGTLSTAAQANITSLGTLTTLTVDNVIINATNIGHTDDTDLLTLADGALTLKGTLTVGVDDTGHDVKFFGASAGAYMEWDESADQLRIMGASADATTSTGKLLLATSLTDINANDVIGKIDFQAPHEAGGTDAITVAASIQAIAQGTFSASVNATDLIFYTGHSEAATEKFRFTSQGELGVGGANYGTDGQVLTSTGAGTAPAWEDAGGGAVSAVANGSDNRVVTFSSSDALNGEANLTFDGSTLAVTGDATVSDDLGLVSDGAVLTFGANSEITLTHVHDVGLNLKHTATADDKPIVLTLQTGETDIENLDTVGAIRFQAPDEGTGGDATLVLSEIAVRAENDYSSSINRSELHFSTSVTETAVNKATMVLGSRGDLNLYNQHGQSYGIYFHHSGKSTHVSPSNSNVGYVSLGASPSAVDAAAVNYTLPNADGSSGQALVTDGSGNMSWATAGSGTGVHDMWIPAAAMRPTTTNGCNDLVTAELSALQPEVQYLGFATDADDHAQFSIAFPKSWNEGTVTYRVYWSSTGSDTGTVQWALMGASFSNANSMAASFGTAVLVTVDALESTANTVQISATSGALTIGGSPAAGDLCFFDIYRDVSGDAMEEDARLLGIVMSYTTDAGTDD